MDYLGSFGLPSVDSFFAAKARQSEQLASSDIPRGAMVIAYEGDDYDKTRPYLFKLNDYSWYQGNTVFHLECVSTKKYPGTNGWTVTKYRSEIQRQEDFEAKKRHKTVAKPKKPTTKQATKAKKPVDANMKAAAEEWLSEYEKKAQRVRDTAEKVVQVAHDGIDDVIDLPQVIGRLLDSYESCRKPEGRYDGRDDHLTEQPLNISEQAIRWSMDYYFGRRLPKLIPIVDEVYERLKKGKHDETNERRFNDMDNSGYIVNAGANRQAFVLTTQSRQYLFIRNMALRELHVRRIWETYKAPKKPDAWEKKETEAFKTGIEHAIRHAGDLAERYSDNLLGNEYIARPDLAFYQKTKFTPRYSDFRDPGYVISFRGPHEGPAATALTKCEVGLKDLLVFENAFFHLLCTVEDLREEQAK